MAANLKQSGFQEMKCDFNYKIFSQSFIDGYKQDTTDRSVMFKILNKLSDDMIDENKNFSEMTVAEKKSFANRLNTDPELDLSRDIINNMADNERLIRTLTDVVSENLVTKREIKVTEINLTGDLLAKSVEEYMGGIQIMPTDVEYKLFVRGVDGLADSLKEKATVWDTKEELQLTSNDLIILRDTNDLRHLNLNILLQDLADAITDNGFLIVVSKYRLTEPEEALISAFGNIAITNSTVLDKRIKTLVTIASSVGLRLICTKTDSISTMTLMFRKLSEIKKIPENNEVIEVTAERDEKWFEAVKDYLITSKDADNRTDNVWLIARDTHINGIIGLVNCLRLEPGGENLRCIFDMDSKLKLPIDWTEKPFSDILANDLVVNVIKDGKLGTFRHLKLGKDYDRTVSNDYFLSMGQNKDLSSLQWYDSRNIVANDEAYDWLGRPIEQVNVQIYSSGLIFKDIMLATGNFLRYPTKVYNFFGDSPPPIRYN